MAFSGVRAIAAIALIVGAALGQATAANAQSFEDDGSVTIVTTLPPPITGTPAPPATLPIDLSTYSSRWSDSWFYSIKGTYGGTSYGQTAAPTDPVSFFPDDVASQWIGAGEAYWFSTTTLTYSDTFYLTGLNTNDLRLSGGWAAEGAGVATLSLNGVTIATLDDLENPGAELVPFSVPTSLFLPDANILSITFTGVGLETDIARVSAFVTNAPIPESSTWAMLLAGFAGLGAMGYRRARQPRAA